jgi:hypothetical protein
MELSIHVSAIQSDLASAAALGDETTAEAGRRLAEALESSLQLRLMDVLTEAALGLSSALRDGHVEVRLSGRNPELVYVEDASPQAVAQPGPGDDLSARITLRLPENLKVQVEVAADREGISTNAWIVRALARALESRGRPGRGGNRLQGFARS